ncbi:MAG: hypothetical protein WC091_03975 [Sulfuricellaceae bacterium]
MEIVHLQNSFKKMSFALLILTVYGCSSSTIKQEVNGSTSTQQSANQTQVKCAGTNELPPEYVDAFEETVDAALLSQAVQEADKGGLCQAKVYINKKNIVIPVYRAWNSTNPNSRLGKWWAFNRPEGKVSTYRKDYEICYGYSPLDMLTQCNLKAGTKIVVGTGQSAMCDAYLTYPISASKQIYMVIDAQAPSVTDCKDYDGVFSWKPVAESMR